MRIIDTLFPARMKSCRRRPQIELRFDGKYRYSLSCNNLGRFGRIIVEEDFLDSGIRNSILKISVDAH